MPPPPPGGEVGRLSLELRGVVQGVGFRPFVVLLASRLGLAGQVRNRGGLVEIEVEGPRDRLDDFRRRLVDEAPPAASIRGARERSLPTTGARGFQVVPSQAGDLVPALPPDLALCRDCAAEVLDPTQRRHGYPFTNCTRCGPRWSIVNGLPYDRAATVMARFPLCPACRAEYLDPEDRRFHAQPIACPACGPRLQGGEAALGAALDALRAGEIVALKGLGGYQLLVDACEAAAVRRLRERKRRASKPLAVLVRDLEAAHRLARIGPEEAACLGSAAAPIVLLEARPGVVAPEVAPGDPWLGVMLPTTPLHLLLSRAFGGPLVCTSGNRSEEPMCLTEAAARARLGAVADHFLGHDRPIARPVDDSVVRVLEGRVEVLRRARGYAPAPLELGLEVDGILALGAHQKSTVALGVGTQAVLSPHLGDLDSPESRRLLESTVDDLVDFFRVAPRRLVTDLHPDYAASLLGEELAARLGIPQVRVQHHHAHVAAVLAEAGAAGPVLGLVWDGAGLGDDGSLWGGEALLVDGAGSRRLGHLRRFPLPGGEAAARQPRRAALGLMAALGDPGAVARWFTREELRVLGARLEAGAEPSTSSMGRLFDGVASLLDLRQRVDHEGEAARALEFSVGTRLEAGEAYEIPLEPAGEVWVGDWRPMLRRVVEDRDAGVPVAVVAGRFHRALVELALGWARRAGRPRVVLGGGCFQNRLLRVAVARRLRGQGFEVLVPGQVPGNDGGIALGQLWVAAFAGAGVGAGLG